ncbi:hypothetical protein ACLMJK_009625 [Lecanora helva]
MRIACLQFAPSIGQPSINIERANALLETADPHDIDLLVLPELAFAGSSSLRFSTLPRNLIHQFLYLGYNYPSLSAIAPYLEPTSQGLSTRWAKETAARFSCVVTRVVDEESPQIGYAELATPTPTSSAPRTSDAEEEVVAHNSCVTVASDGSVLAHYRKTHLFMTDETWAQPSPQGWLTAPLVLVAKTQQETTVNVSWGICMDLNPYKFEAPWTAYEFASHALASQADVLILSMAWLTQLDSQALAQESGKPDLSTLSYWIERLHPLVMVEKKVIVVCANRCGEEPSGNPSDSEGEDGARYAGSSWVGIIGGGEVKLWDILGRGEEDVMVVDVGEKPKWTIVPGPPNG